MGYTHYWTISSPDREAFGRLALDTKQILETTSVKICGWDGTGDPEITEGRIAFNGDASTEDDYETFSIESEEQGFSFCKTSGVRPYDAVVCAVLLRAADIYGDAIEVKSDGDWPEWQDGRDLYAKVFGIEAPKPAKVRD